MGEHFKIRWGAGPVRLRCRVCRPLAESAGPGGTKVSLGADTVRVDVGPPRVEGAEPRNEHSGSAASLVRVVQDEVVELGLAGVRVVPVSVLQARHPLIAVLLDGGGSAPCQHPAASGPEVASVPASLAVFTWTGGGEVDGWVGVPGALFHKIETAIASGGSVAMDLLGNGGFHTLTPAGEPPREIVFRPDESVAFRFHHAETRHVSTP